MTLMGLQLAPVNDQNVGHGRHLSPVSLHHIRNEAGRPRAGTVWIEPSRDRPER